MTNFKIGDMVQLKSGGPAMTIQRIISLDEDPSFNQIDDYIKLIKGFKKGDVICQWFIDNKLKQSAFPAESLVKDNK